MLFCYILLFLKTFSSNLFFQNYLLYLDNVYSFVPIFNIGHSFKKAIIEKIE